MAAIAPADIDDAKELLEIARTFHATPTQVKNALALMVCARRPTKKWVPRNRVVRSDGLSHSRHRLLNIAREAVSTPGVAALVE